MNQLFLLIWDVVGKGIKVTTVLYILVLYLPSILSLTVPMAVMVASCMAFGRFAQDMEIVAFRATGRNPLTLNISPLITMGVMFTLGMIWFNNHILPDANHKLKNVLIDISQKKPCFRMKAFVTMRDLEGYDMQVGSIDYKKSEIRKIKLFEKETNREIFAKKGTFYADNGKITLILKDGEIHELFEKGRYRRLTFTEHKIYIPMDQESIRRDRTYRGERELSARGLKEKIKKLQKETKDKKYLKRRTNTLLVEYHKKYSIPSACFVFIIIGCPLAIRIKRRGAGFGLALLFFIFYYICLIGGEHLGDRGIVPPWLSMWFPNIMLFIIGSWITYWTNKR
jgi:lipopolysaccharide export system permease protein